MGSRATIASGAHSWERTQDWHNTTMSYYQKSPEHKSSGEKIANKHHD